MATAAPHRNRATTPQVPPVAGMPVEVWSWLRESLAVRPHVVARVRASLLAGEQATPDDVARSMLLETALAGPAGANAHRPYRGAASRS